MFESNLLKNKNIIVTGGGSGLGKSMARRFGELGANVVIFGRRKDILKETENEFKNLGIKVLSVDGDVRKPEDVQRLLD